MQRTRFQVRKWHSQLLVTMSILEHLPVPGLHHSIRYPKKYLETGTHMETIVLWMEWQLLTVILFLTFMSLQLPSMDQLFSPSWTSYMHIIKFLWSQLIPTKWPRSHSMILRMPFGLCNTARTFKWIINQVLLHGLPFFIIASPTFDERNVCMTLNHLKEYGIIILPSKCVLAVSSLHILGHLIESQGICPLEEKARVVQDFALPVIRHDLHKFLSIFTTISSQTVFRYYYFHLAPTRQFSGIGISKLSKPFPTSSML